MTNKIIALWGTPRSVTTAFEKTFSQRLDTEILHEPFGDIYYLSKWRKSDRVVNYFGENEDKLNYDVATLIKEITIKAKETSIVFFKDFPYQILPYFDDNIKEFLKSIINTFIIRNSHEVLASWYKAEQELTKKEFGGEITEEEFGFSGLSKMFEIVNEELRQKPIIVEANRFRQNPEKVLNSYCEKIGINFDSCMLTWQEGRLKQWNPNEEKIHKHWHDSLNNSVGINPPIEVDIKIRTEHLEMVKKAVSVYQKLVCYAL